MSAAIYTMTHTLFTPPEDPIYIPLQVGHVLHDDYGYPGDDTGDNISAKNPYYSELTGLYWVWKNATPADYLGLCHYRRYFLNQAGNLMTEADYMDILTQYDVMIARPQTGPYTYRSVYSRSHNIHYLDMTGDIIRELYPAYYDTFQDVILENKCYVGNLFAAPKVLFDAYCEWLFTILFALEERITIDEHDDYHRRVFGFLSEQLLFVWVKANQLSYYESSFGVKQEKAETITLKQELQAIIQNGDLSAAYQHLCHTLDRRPDLSLEMSDFDQELTTIEHILNICRVEEAEGLPTLLQFSRDFTILIPHFRLLLVILEHIQNDCPTEDEIHYLLACKVSYKAILYLLQNFRQFSSTPQICLNALALIYAKGGEYLTALSLLSEALAICESNRNTLYHIITVLEQMGQPEIAEEYRELYTAAPKRIAVFTGGKIPVLNYLAEQYAASLEELGHTVFRYNKSNMEQSYIDLRNFRENGLDLSLVFNNVGFQMFLSSGKSLWDLWSIPCCNIIVDHPMYYADTLDHAPENGIVVCADRNHTNYINRFYSTVRRTLFLPTAGECLKSFPDLKPFSERRINILFIGTYKYDDSLHHDDFSLQLTEQMIQHPGRTFEETVEDCLKTNQTNLSDIALKDYIQQYRFVEKNIGALFRAKILQILVDSGIAVTVYGDQFEKTPLYGHPNFLYKGRCSIEEGIRLMEDSKIVLNQLAWFKAGSSERIYEAMLQGAISLTDDSVYLRETFTDGIDIKFYSLNRLHELPNIVRAILSNPEQTEMLRTNAYHKAAHHHTWLQRTETLLTDLRAL